MEERCREVVESFVDKTGDINVCFQALAQVDEKVSLLRRTPSAVLDALDRHPPARELLMNTFLRRIEEFRWDAQRGMNDLEPTKRKLEQILHDTSLQFNRRRESKDDKIEAEDVISLSILEAMNLACGMCLDYWLVLKEAVQSCDASKIFEARDNLEKNTKRVLQF